MTNKNLLTAMNIKPNDISFGKKKTFSGGKHLSSSSASATAALNKPSKTEDLEEALKARFTKTHANDNKSFDGAYNSEEKRYKY